MSLYFKDARKTEAADKFANKDDKNIGMYAEIQNKIDKLKRWGGKGYWRDQLDFLEHYIADGTESKLLRYALNYLNLEPLSILEDIDGFYDSSAYVCCDKNNLCVGIDNKLKDVIKTYGVGSYKIQFPVPNKEGKFDKHMLVVFDRRDGSRLLFTLNSTGAIDVNRFKL